MLSSISDPLQVLAPGAVVGSWHWDVADGRVVLDRGSAELLAGNADLAGQALDIDTSFHCLHPEDRDRVFALVDEHAQKGGAIVLEYRVLSPEGRVRLLLDYGHVFEATDGAKLGQGLLLDITDSLRSSRVTPDPGAATLADAADACLGMRDAILREGTPVMKLLIDTLLLELGRAAARRAAEPIH